MYSDFESNARGNDSHRPCKMSAQQLLQFRIFYPPKFYLLQRNSNLAQIDLYNILYTFKDSSYLTLQYILGDSLNQGFNIT